MKTSEMNTLIEQYLTNNTVTKIPQSQSKKHNQPTFPKFYGRGISGRMIG